ncbi:hypothetical protein E2320_000061, partial [Naja naja]
YRGAAATHQCKITETGTGMYQLILQLSLLIADLLHGGILAFKLLQPQVCYFQGLFKTFLKQYRILFENGPPSTDFPSLQFDESTKECWIRDVREHGLQSRKTKNATHLCLSDTHQSAMKAGHDQSTGRAN